MAIPVIGRGAYRYLGNTHTKEVHDLNNEKTSCQISEIFQAHHGVRFDPDSKDKAHSEGYDNCQWCIGGSKR
jgi:hypothetical protein